MFYFIKALSLIVVFTSLSLTTGASPKNPPPNKLGIQFDVLGNQIIDSSGNAIYFSEEDSSVRNFDLSVASFSSVTSSTTPQSLTSSSDTNSLHFNKIWSTHFWGTSIGREGLIVSDIDADGSKEIIFGASISGFARNTRFQVAAFDTSSSSYIIEWSSEIYTSSISEIALVDIGGAKKIAVGLDNGQLDIFDAMTLALESSRNLGFGIKDILSADTNSNGTTELVIVGSQITALLDPSTLNVLSQPGYGGESAVIGNVDSTDDMEIIFSSGSVISIDSTFSAHLKWDFSLTGEAGTYLALGDANQDGIQEIYSARNWYYIDIYDAILKSPVGQIRTSTSLHALTLADVTGDGREEILYGDAQHGSVHALDIVSRTELWSIRNLSSGVTRIAVSDIDGDGEDEVLWGSGWATTGSDQLQVHDVATQQQEFISQDIVGPFDAVTQGDADNDGSDEIIAISFESNSGYDDGVIHIFDANTFELEWVSSDNMFGGRAWTGIHDVAVGDVDGDGKNEIVVATDELYDGAIYLIDAGASQAKAFYEYDSGSPLYAVTLSDINGDGVEEIIAGGGKEHTGSPGTFVYIIDGRNGAVLWKSVSLSSGWGDSYSIEARDLNSDGVDDIIVSIGQITVIDGATRTINKSSVSYLRGFSITQEGSNPIIWAGSQQGQLYKLDGRTLEQVNAWQVCDQPINSVLAGKSNTLLDAAEIACDNELVLFDYRNERSLWRSEAFSSQIGRNNNLQIMDSGNLHIMVAGHRNGLIAFSGYGNAVIDIDEDGILNSVDNCPELGNPDQIDTDGDGVGNACNDHMDQDNDEWRDDLDNCPLTNNPIQQDTDSSGIGDACNNALDADGDEWEEALDNCALIYNPNQENSDGDDLGDACDPYPTNPNNYEARCEEAIDNEFTFFEQLGVCLAERKFSDEDADGEEDSTDKCPNTTIGAAVDANGCSQVQFCEAVNNMTPAARLQICVAADWNNDQPLDRHPGDCEVNSQARAIFKRQCVAADN